MKTKKIELWVDIYPGWQDMAAPALFPTPSPNPYKLEGSKRVKITVELPCFGGSAEQDFQVGSMTEVLKEGLQVG